MCFHENFFCNWSKNFHIKDEFLHFWIFNNVKNWVNYANRQSFETIGTFELRWLKCLNFETGPSRGKVRDFRTSNVRNI